MLVDIHQRGLKGSRTVAREGEAPSTVIPTTILQLKNWRKKGNHKSKYGTALMGANCPLALTK